MTRNAVSVQRTGRTREWKNQADRLEEAAAFFGLSARRFGDKVRGDMVHLQPRSNDPGVRTMAGSVLPGARFTQLLPQRTDRVIVQAAGSVSVSEVRYKHPPYMTYRMEGKNPGFLQIACLGNYSEP